MDTRCVHCGSEIKALFIQYSPGNIRLMKCEHCKAAADEYIECEILILFIDMILHKPDAYRHLLYNMVTEETVNLKGLFWKSALLYLLLDVYRASMLIGSAEEWGSSSSYFLLFWRYGKILMNVFIQNFLFLCVLLLASRTLPSTFAGVMRYKKLLLAFLLSSYFKMFLVAMMVWEFPVYVIFVIDLFVFSSNTVALRVIMQSDLSSSLAVCFAAHSVKLLVDQVFHTSLSRIFKIF